MEIREVDSRNEKTAKKHRSKARAVVLAISILILIALAIGILSYTVLFPIEHINVTGNTIYTSKEVIDSSKLSLGDKLYSISQKDIENILTLDLPYIKSVELRRNIFPEATLEIIVTETTDVFCYEHKSMYYTADEDNKVLSKFTTQPESTTLIKTNKKLDINLGKSVLMDENDFKNVKMIHSKLSSDDLSIGYIDISNENSVKILIDNRFIVEFGTVSNLDGKIAHLNGMVDKIIEKNGKDTMGRIDLSAWTNKNQRAYYEPCNIF